MHVLDRWEPEGEGFSFLGVDFDADLSMRTEVEALADRCHWKLRTLLRAKRFFTTPQLVAQYKSHVLPFVEHSTPAVYHAISSVLDTLDRVQKTFLRRLGLTEAEALTEYNLAPLRTRRDVAMLGVVHRTVLGESPPHFSKWFFRAPVSHLTSTRLQDKKHHLQLHDCLGGEHTELLRRSALGLPRVYNKLLKHAVECKTVSSFQKAFQKLVKESLDRGDLHWQTLHSPRDTKVEELVSRVYAARRT